MNTATALREIRKNLKFGCNLQDLYLKYNKYLKFPELDAIICPELRYKILEYYILKNDNVILKFANGLTDELFDFDRFKEYKEYRMQNNSDSRSEKFFKLKYGKNWEYFRSLKQKERFNPYNIHDYMIKRGQTLDEANKLVSSYKKKTAPNLQKLIDKHGEDEGKMIFFKNCRRHKNYIDYWNKIYPNDPIKAQAEFKKYTTTASLKHVNHYIAKGFTEHEAKELITKHQFATAGVHRKYYEMLGLESNDIDNILKNINKRKDSSSIEFLLRSNPNLDFNDILVLYSEKNKLKSSSYRINGYLKKDDPNLEEEIAYYAAVNYYTRLSMKYMSPCPGKKGKRVNEYHIDHKYSIKQGYLDNISPKIIGNVVNLEWILSSTDCAKRGNCSITKEQLLKDFKSYEN